MNKRQTTLLTHVTSWAALLFLPLMFVSQREGLNMRHLLMSTGVTLSFICVYYANFLWITPKYYAKNEWIYLLLSNIVIILLVAVGLHYWMSFCHSLYPDTKFHHGSGISITFILRDMFNLGVVAVVGTSMQLASQWRKNEEARREAEAARTEAELKTLRNQINPHFLLNTLNNIYALTSFDTEKAQQAIQQLSKLLRHLLYNNELSTVPLEEEVNFLENYINLMRIRLSKSVDVSFQRSIANYQQPIAPMIFISLIENAFKHGISPTEHSFIHIRITADEHQICCEIENSNHPKSEKDHSGHGIGLQQVERRLDLSYKDHYVWERGVSSDGSTYHSRIQINCKP